jgi:poly(3-hydroxybutyrate) depolymerase
MSEEVNVTTRHPRVMKALALAFALAVPVLVYLAFNLPDEDLAATMATLAALCLAAAGFISFAGLIGWRRPSAPGYYVTGKKFALRGRLEAAPLLWPSREFLLYVPRGYGGWTRHPLVVLIHGCKQTPEEIAAGTRIAALADQHGWLVLLPRQTSHGNPWSCWNWFDAATAAGRGETAIVAAQVKSVRRGYRIHPRRIFVAGMSAGGALAAALGVHHPQLFSGVFIHSGLASGAAAGPASAIKVMGQGAETDSQLIGERARVAAGGAIRLPLLAIHGEGDSVVAKINAFQLVRQYLALNGRGALGGAANARPAPDFESIVPLHDGRSMTIAEYRDGRRVMARLVQVPQLGHAWSGGDPAYPFNDANPPDATALLGEFIEGRLRP